MVKDDGVRGVTSNPAIFEKAISGSTDYRELLASFPDSPLADTPVAKMPHTSWAVDDLDAELEGKDVVVAPLTAAEGVRIAYFMNDGALIEYLEIKQ